MPFELVASDTGSTLKVTCKDNADSAVIDLTGSTVKLKYKIGAGALVTKTMTLDADPTTGIATYQFGASELTKGELEGEVEITDSGSKVITSLDTIRLPIRGKLA